MTGNTWRHSGQIGVPAGPMQEGDGGNGALMRNLPVALATWPDARLMADVSLALSLGMTLGFMALCTTAIGLIFRTGWRLRE